MIDSTDSKFCPLTWTIVPLNPADGENVDISGGGQSCPSFGGIGVGVDVSKSDFAIASSLSDSLFVLSNLIELFFEVNPTWTADAKDLVNVSRVLWNSEKLEL